MAGEYMDIQTNLLLGSTIIGIVNTVQLQFPRVTGTFALLLAVALGLALSPVFAIPYQMGLVTAFASSGVYKIASKMGGN